MNVGRVVLAVTCLVVAGLGAWFAVVRWDEASKVATLAAALAGVAAVGVAVWAALPARQYKSGIRVIGTGNATAGNGGVANSGLRASVDKLPDRIEIGRTGKADAAGGGIATTGAQLDRRSEGEQHGHS
jgi:hypothetical protein